MTDGGISTMPPILDVGLETPTPSTSRETRHGSANLLPDNVPVEVNVLACRTSD